MACKDFSWRAIDAEPVPLHDLEDSHLVNILRYLGHRYVEFVLRGIDDSAYSDTAEFLKAVTIPALEKEAKRRKMNLEEIYSTFDHPDPEEFRGKKRGTKDSLKKRTRKVPKK